MSFLFLLRPSCAIQRPAGFESQHEPAQTHGAKCEDRVAEFPPQERIIVRIILNRLMALSAWGWPAGIRIISPPSTR
jgi:hypothetical protein